MKLSKYQKDVLKWQGKNVGLESRHLVVNAVAGSGKTTMALELFKAVPELSKLYLAFNAEIRQAVTPKLAKVGGTAHTYHSFGIAAIRATYGGVVVDKDKVIRYIGEDTRYNFLKWKVRKLVAIAKGSGSAQPDDDWLERAAIEYDIDFEDSAGRVNRTQMALCFDGVRRAITYSIENPTVVDYEDMIFLPYILAEEISIPEVSLLVIDELQDTNFIQTHLAMRALAQGGNIIGIGDRNQAIYAFRGAGSNSIDDFKAMVGAAELPLSLSYRCSKAVGMWVNINFPNIQFEVPRTAIQGEVGSKNNKYMLENAKEGDLILCRVNADLLKTAFEFLRAGKRVTVKGRNFGEGLAGLVKQSRADTVKEFLDWLSAWKDRKLLQAAKIDSEAKRQSVLDKFDALCVIADNAADASEIERRCNSLFSDEARGITLSTVHKAKGLEVETADNHVWILRPDLMPHPAAHGKVQEAQEANIRYVAGTRAKNGLYFVT